MKEFAVYTGLRLLLFAACSGILWAAFHNSLGFFPVLLLALILSSILSVFVLRAARDRLAGTIERRATRMSQRIEAARRAEDDD
jgi:hypothetical protein